MRSSKLPRNGAQNYRPRFTCKSRSMANSRRRLLSHCRVVFYLFHRHDVLRRSVMACEWKKGALLAVVKRDLFPRSRLCRNVPCIKAPVRSYHSDSDLRRGGFRLAASNGRERVTGPRKSQRRYRNLGRVLERERL